MVSPPPYEVNPDDLDETNNPTGAWTIGELLDQDTIDRLEHIARGNN